jgi:hypothetical protein
MPARSVSRSGVLPNGERIPNVRVERLLPNGSCCWARQLASVEDDLESRYLAAQRSKLEFSLTVPNHGAAGCFLWFAVLVAVARWHSTRVRKLLTVPNHGAAAVFAAGCVHLGLGRQASQLSSGVCSYGCWSVVRQ